MLEVDVHLHGTVHSLMCRSSGKFGKLWDQLYNFSLSSGSRFRDSDINFRPGVRSGHTYLGSGNCGATGRVGGCSEADGAMA